MINVGLIETRNNKLNYKLKLRNVEQRNHWTLNSPHPLDRSAGLDPLDASDMHHLNGTAIWANDFPQH